MKRLDSVENNSVKLEVFECDCGFHIGIDATYLDQDDDVIINCPVCKNGVFDTKKLAPEVVLNYSVKTTKAQTVISLMDAHGKAKTTMRIKKGECVQSVLSLLNESGYQKTA